MTGSVPIFLSFCEKYVLVTLWNVLNIYSDQTHNKEKPDSRKWTAPRPTQLAPQCRRHCQDVSFDQFWLQLLKKNMGKFKYWCLCFKLLFFFKGSKPGLSGSFFLRLLTSCSQVVIKKSSNDNYVLFKMRIERKMTSL